MPITTVSLDQSGAVPVVRVRGELDLATIESFKAETASAAALERGAVVISLVDATYCDSATVHALMLFRSALEGDGQKLLLVLPDRGTTRRVLDMVGMTKTMATYRTVSEALIAAKGS
jgi:anti-anti-sigma factor